MIQNQNFQATVESEDLNDPLTSVSQGGLSRRSFLQASIGGAVGASSLAALLAGKASAAEVTTTLFATADTFIRQDQPNRNEGAGLLLRVGAGPLMRTLVQFNAAEIADAIKRPGFRFKSAHLVLQAAAARGQRVDAATVDAHPLLRTFAEGNGGAINLPFGFGQGAGTGATWNCFADANIRDNRPDPFNLWSGGQFGRTALPGLVPAGPINQGQELRWNVSSDVLAGHFSWLLKLSDGAAAGELSFYSKEGARYLSGAIAPRLELITEPLIAQTGAADASLWRIEMDTSTPGQPAAKLMVSVNGGAFQDFKLKGVCYSPAPIGSSSNFAPTIGDYFWDGFSVSGYTINGWDPLWARDLSRLRALGANTIRTYAVFSHHLMDNGQIPDPDSADFQGRLRTHKRFLDACWNGGNNPLYVLIGIPTPETTWWKERYVDNQGGPLDAQKAKFWDRVIAETAKQLGNHPAVLGFTLLNELADPPHAYAEPAGGTTQARATELTEFFWGRVQTMAALVKSAAPYKLVGVALHDNPKYAGPGAPFLTTIPSVDFYGVNTYQPINLDSIFRPVPNVGNGYNGLTGAALKAVIITEFGMPATNHRGGDRGTIYEDATTRQRAAEVVGHIVPQALSEKLCLGLYYFEYCDEWWKTPDGSGGDSIFRWLGGDQNGGLPNCYRDESAFGLYSVARGAGVGPTDPPYVGGPASAGPRLPIDTLTERTEITAALKAAFAGGNPFPGIPRLCGQ